MLHGRIPLTILVTALLSAVMALPAQAAPVYPDLQTFEPREFLFQDRDPLEETEPCPPATPACRPPGPRHRLLRFTNTVYNGGEGRLEVFGTVTNPGQPGSEGRAIQRIFEDDGSESSTQDIGRFYWHAAHSHYHFDDWGSYQLWTKSDYDAWRAHGNHAGHEDEASRRGVKTTSCVMDEEFIGGSASTPFPGRYPSGGCTPNSTTGLMKQGLSPGWGDTYDYYRAEQWIDLGPTGSPGSVLAPGRYVLRSVTDPKNLIYESAGKADSSRETIYNDDSAPGTLGNEATYEILLDSAGRFVDQTAPTGTIAINDVDESTASRAVDVKVIGRDDVSDVTSYRVGNSAAEAAAAPLRTYRGTGSTPDAFRWILEAGAGTKTVFIQLRDASGKTTMITDSIELEAGGSGDSDYSEEVLADLPAGYWRLGEASGTFAANSATAGTANSGTYARAPQLGVTSLVPSETNTATRFNAAARQHVAVPHSGSLNPTSGLTVEAWIKPDSIPAGFATVAAKPGAYALQFTGGQLEFKVEGDSTPAAAVAPAGAIQAGRAYHVVGTYDRSNVKLYVEGRLVSTTPLTQEPASSPDSFHIAGWRGETEFLSATIDDVAVYGDALSAARVAQHREAAELPPPPPPPPVTVNAPTGLKAVAKSTSTIQLNWTDKSANESEFVIQRSISPSFASAKTFSTEADEEQLVDTGLIPNTTYYYRVRAHLAAALRNSAWSNVATARTLAAGDGGGGDNTPKPPFIPPTPPPVFPAAKVSFAGAKSAIRTDSKGRLTYTFRVTGGTSGLAKFITRKTVRTSSKSKRKRHVTFLAKGFKVPRSGKIVLKLKLSKKGFAILKRNKTVYLKVRVGAYGRGPAKFAEKRLTLKAPKPKR